MLDYAWLIPAIPFASFWLILFFGKKMPRQGSEIGITALGASFILSCIVAVEWIQRVNDAAGGHEGLGTLQAFGKGFMAAGGEHHAVVTPVIHTVTWWENGFVKFTAGTSIDGLAAMMLFVVTLISLLVHVYSTSYMHGDERYTYFYAALSLFS